jgi:hypothetical protein
MESGVDFGDEAARKFVPLRTFSTFLYFPSDFSRSSASLDRDIKPGLLFAVLAPFASKNAGYARN